MSLLFAFLAYIGIYILGNRFDGKSYPDILSDFLMFWSGLFEDWGRALYPVLMTVVYFVGAPYFALVKGMDTHSWANPWSYLIGSIVWLITLTFLAIGGTVGLGYLDLVYWGFVKR